MKRLLLVSVLIFSASAPLLGQWTVYDPVNYAVAVKELAEGVKTYQQVMQSYQLAQQMSYAIKSLPYSYRYALIARLHGLDPSSRCLNCGGWSSAANGGMAGSDYGGAVLQLQDSGRLTTLLSGEAQRRLQARMATGVYLPDAATRNDLEALGGLRTNDPEMARYVQQCQSDVLNASYNSQVQVAQSSGACATVMAQQQTSTNKLLGALVEHRSIDEARRMNSEIESLNTEIARAQLHDQTQTQTGGLGSAVRGLRIGR